MTTQALEKEALKNISFQCTLSFRDRIEAFRRTLGERSISEVIRQALEEAMTERSI